MNPFARIYVEKIRKMIEEADVAFLLSDRIRREALCLVSYLKMQHLFWFYYFTEEENTLLLSCNSTAKPSASLVLLKKNIQLYFLVNFPTANPTEMMKIMQTQHAFELFCPQNIIRKETIKQQSINQQPAHKQWSSQQQHQQYFFHLFQLECAMIYWQIPSAL